MANLPKTTILALALAVSAPAANAGVLSFFCGPVLKDRKSSVAYLQKRFSANDFDQDAFWREIFDLVEKKPERIGPFFWSQLLFSLHSMPNASDSFFTSVRILDWLEKFPEDREKNLNLIYGLLKEELPAVLSLDDAREIAQGMKYLGENLPDSFVMSLLQDAISVSIAPSGRNLSVLVLMFVLSNEYAMGQTSVRLGSKSSLSRVRSGQLQSIVSRMESEISQPNFGAGAEVNVLVPYFIVLDLLKTQVPLPLVDQVAPLVGRISDSMGYDVEKMWKDLRPQR